MGRKIGNKFCGEGKNVWVNGEQKWGSEHFYDENEGGGEWTISYKIGAWISNINRKERNEGWNKNYKCVSPNIPNESINFIQLSCYFIPSKWTQKDFIRRP